LHKQECYKMMTLAEVRSGLQDRVVEAVSAATGIHRNTIAAIKSGKNENPTYFVMRKLSDYLGGDHLK
jgi:transcriptional regulator with XRE-family HTH domain